MADENPASSGANRENESFEQMMAIAQFASKGHSERRQVVFRVFVSYLTLLVAIASAVMKHWYNLDNMFDEWWKSAGIGLALGFMAIFYWYWLTSIYRGLIFDVRRRDFYLRKAEVICFYRSKFFASRINCSEKVSLNLGSGDSYQLKKTEFFEKSSPDIECYLTYIKGPSKPKVRRDAHFLFNLVLPLSFTALIVLGLASKSSWWALTGALTGLGVVPVGKGVFRIGLRLWSWIKCKIWHRMIKCKIWHRIKCIISKRQKCKNGKEEAS